MDLKDAPVFKLDLSDEALVKHLTASQVDGKVVITQMEPRLSNQYRSVNRILRAAKAALVILSTREASRTMPGRTGCLVDAERARQRCRQSRAFRLPAKQLRVSMAP